METMNNYINDGLKHLSNTDMYHRLEKDDFNLKLYENINRYLDHIFERGLNNLDSYNFLTLVKKPSSYNKIILVLHKIL